MHVHRNVNGIGIRFAQSNRAMILIELLARIISALRSAATPPQIAGGFVIGMAIGFIPSLPLDVILFVVLFLINVNLASGLLAALIFSGIAYLLDPVFHSLGYLVLARTGPLRPFWTALYNTPFVPFSGYNNTVVMGSAIIALVLLYPVFVMTRIGVVRYRERYEPIIGRWPVVRVIQHSMLYRWYERLRRLGERLP